MPSPHDLDGIVSRARAKRIALQQRIQALLGRHALYRRLFLAKSGELSADTEALLRDLAAYACADRPAYPNKSMSLERIEGRRDVYFRLTEALRLDGARLAQMQLQIREIGDE